MRSEDDIVVKMFLLDCLDEVFTQGESALVAAGEAKTLATYNALRTASAAHLRTLTADERSALAKGMVGDIVKGPGFVPGVVDVLSHAPKPSA
jgi:hypothetical protein